MWDFTIDDEINKVNVQKYRKDGSINTFFFVYTDLDVKSRSDGYLEYLTRPLRVRLSSPDNESLDIDKYAVHAEFNRKLNPKIRSIDHEWLNLIIDGNIVSNDKDLRDILIVYVETLKD